ncbi:MAG: hypothetical protein LBG84_08725 [Treponema sp.]|jgi:hypothetical protein|nr:hypothetical protein [Treponema sp.]
MNLSLFPPEERPLRTRLLALMADWKREVARSSVVFREDGKAYSGDEYFCADGFFPYYTRQKTKILFIGREAVGLSGMDYIDVMFNAYKRNSVAGKTLDAHATEARQFYLAYGISRGGAVPYAEVPYASELAKTFGTAEGVSFAFMELSKYSNDAEDANARRDAELMTRFLRDSHLEKRNFPREELSLLDPDVILTMNLWNAGVDAALVEQALGGVRFAGSPEPAISVNALSLNGREVPLFDLWHFSSRKSTERDFYDPVMRAWRGETGRGSGPAGP